MNLYAPVCPSSVYFRGTPWISPGVYADRHTSTCIIPAQPHQSTMPNVSSLLDNPMDLGSCLHDGTSGAIIAWGTLCHNTLCPVSTMLSISVYSICILLWCVSEWLMTDPHHPWCGMVSKRSATGPEAKCWSDNMGLNIFWMGQILDLF